MELKHGVVVGSKPWHAYSLEPAVQDHLDENVSKGWALQDHSVAAYVEPTSNATVVVYSFVWRRDRQTIVNIGGERIN